MEEFRWEAVHGILMTSESVPAYGGVGFPREALEQVAAAIRSQTVPFHLDHDLRKPVRVRNFDAFVKGRDDGIFELRFTAEVHPDDVATFGERKGMSATIMVPLERASAYEEPINPSIEVAADAAWFSDSDLLAAESALIRLGVATDKIKTERALQFSFTPDPQIFVEIGLDLLISLGASALWEGIAHIFRSRKTPPEGDSSAPTRVNIQIVNGARSVTAVVETDDPAVAMRAVSAIEDLGRQTLTGSEASAQLRDGSGTAVPSAIAKWDDPTRKWVPPA